MRWRSGGDWKCPMVIRCPVGGYLKGGAVYHSQSGDTLFTHMPGLRVVYPSNALDANGLLRTAIRCDDPVLFLEHKHLYRQAYNKSQYPPDRFSHPVRQGEDACARAQTSRSSPTARSFSVRSSPPSRPSSSRASTSRSSTCARSRPTTGKQSRATVRKTSKVIVAHEDTLSYGFGAEIAARISRRAVRISRRSRPPRRRARHLRRLRSAARRRDPPASGRRVPRDHGALQLLKKQ